MRKEIAYDKAEWHFNGNNYPADLPMENSYTHIAFFLRWCIENDFINPAEFSEQALEKISLIKKGLFDCREFLIKWIDGCLLSCLLNMAGQEFADNYYDNDKSRLKNKLKHWTFYYLDDFWHYQKTKKMTYTKVHQKGAIYSVENTEHNYQAIKKLIDKRYKIFLDMKSGKIGNSSLQSLFSGIGINWDFFKRKK